MNIYYIPIGICIEIVMYGYMDKDMKPGRLERQGVKGKRMKDLEERYYRRMLKIHEWIEL